MARFSVFAFAFLILLGGCPTALSAQSTPEYPPIFPGLTGHTLIDSLRLTYTPTTALAPQEAYAVIWDDLHNDNGSVTGVYSGATIAVDPQASQPVHEQAAQQGFGVEHTYPASRGAAMTIPAYADLHHLFPARAAIDSVRAHWYFDDVAAEEADLWYRSHQTLETTPVSGSRFYSRMDLDRPRFEPPDAHKGNVARALFYLYAIYEEHLVGVDPFYFEGQREVLYRWHVLDPVDAAERARSDRIAGYQGRGNPFVEDTTLARRAYMTGYALQAPHGFDLDVWINELHYDNVGVDEHEGVELAGPALMSLQGWSVRLYDGVTGAEYDPYIAFDSTTSIPASPDQNSIGVLWLDIPGIRNEVGGIAVVSPFGEVVEFISFEGTFEATHGAARGQTSVDIGVWQDENTPISTSLSRKGVGVVGRDFSWESVVEWTPGQANKGQFFSNGSISSRDPVHVVSQGIRMDGGYPNPATGELILSLRVQEVVFPVITIVDMLGRVVAEYKHPPLPIGTTELKLDLRHLATGMYVVTVASSHHRASHTITIIR